METGSGSSPLLGADVKGLDRVHVCVIILLALFYQLPWEVLWHGWNFTGLQSLVSPFYTVTSFPVHFVIIWLVISLQPQLSSQCVVVTLFPGIGSYTVEG